jgi:uncharacterized protein (DUF362 family)
MSLSVELSMTYVSLIKSDYTNFRQALERAVDLIGKIHLEDKNSIAVKINLCDCRPPETGAITHPESLDAVLGYLRSNFPKIPIYVVESDATVTRPDLLIDWFGFRGVIEKWNAEWRNLTHEKTQRMKIKGRHFKSVKVPTLLRDSFIVNLSKLKTHSLTKISCSLKNQYGCIVYPLKIHFHGFLDDAIVDANTAMPSNLSIVDGVVAMGGAQGPAYGIPLNAGVLFVGSDPVAVDAACGRFMGFNPYFIGHVRKAASAGLGRIRCNLVGDSIEPIDFGFDRLEYTVLKFANYLQSRSRRT